MNSLNRKLVRDLMHLRGQIIATALVVACGVASFISMRSTYDSLRITQEEYYRQYGFAEVFLHMKRAPESLRARIREIPGVAAIETRVVADVNLNLPGLAEPASGKIVSIPDRESPALNGLHMVQGRHVQPGSSSEVIISEAFANANDFHPGDRIEAVINGHWRQLTIVGVALSPEFIYEIRGGDIFPDNRRFGILWMGRAAVGGAFDMTGAFNDLALTLAPGANEREVIVNVDRILDEYGGGGAYGRSEQQSHRFISNEFAQLEVQGVFLPAIFLGVTAFLLHIVLSRLVNTQREQIGLLMAFGYGNFDVGLHFLKLAFAAVAGGMLLGTGLGIWLGSAMTNLYTEYFHFPILEFAVSWTVLLVSSLITFGTAAVGSVAAVLKAVNLPPAEAMRPEMPPQFRAGFLERIGLQRFLTPAHRVIVRSLSRHPAKAALSTLGVAAAAALLFTGFYFFDAINHIIDIQFRQAIRNDVDVIFHQPEAGRTRHELAQLRGVMAAEPFRVVPVRLRSAHRSKRTALIGTIAKAELRRIVDKDANVVHPPTDGLLISNALADLMRVRVGDTLTAEVLEGSRPVIHVPVVGIVDELMGLNAYIELHALNRLMNEDDVISGAYLAVDAVRTGQLYLDLKEKPAVASVGMPGVMLDSFNETFGRTIGVFTFFLVSFASVIVLGVVYNGARISLSERGRELASLRVLGFTKFEIATILLGEQAIIAVAAIPLGFVLGYFICLLSNNLVDTEILRLPMVFSARTFIVTSAATALAAGVSGLLVVWRLQGLDLIEVLKTRE